MYFIFLCIYKNSIIYIYIRIIYYEYLWTPQMSSPVTFKVNWPWGDIRSRCTFTISPSLQANMFQLSMVNLRCQIYTFDSPSRLRWIHLTFIYCCANSYIYLFVNEKTCYIILPWIATYESDWKSLKYRAKLDPLRTFKRLWKKKTVKLPWQFAGTHRTSCPWTWHQNHSPVPKIRELFKGDVSLVSLPLGASLEAKAMDS